VPHPLTTLALAAAVAGAAGCSGHATRFCGLVDTANGFDYVQATGVGCGNAFAATRAVERGDHGEWECSRSVGGAVELTCRVGEARIDLLERSPVPARRHGPDVTLANLTFRLGRGVLSGRGPWCVPDVPREVLVALRLRPLTTHGGCFTSSHRTTADHPSRRCPCNGRAVESAP
jgi:hypothetical protein